MTDSKAQRVNMVESQVRPSDITDRRIVRAMLDVPREAFVPQDLASIAYMDVDVPLKTAGDEGPARYLLAPRVFAKLVQEARVEADMTVLDVGCATGYSAAILGRLARKVAALECDAALAAKAGTVLASLGVANVSVNTGSLEAGLAGAAPFDVIFAGGAMPAAPDALLGQLKDGGRLVTVIADGYFGQACVFTRTGQVFDRRIAFDAGAHPLPGFARKAEFVF